MTSLLVDHIGELVTNDPTLGDGVLGLLRDAAVVAEDGRVVWIGPAQAAPPADERLDADGGAVLPGFVDSHTHSSSPGTGRTSSPPGWRVSPTPARGSPPRWRPPGPRLTGRCAPPRRG